MLAAQWAYPSMTSRISALVIAWVYSLPDSALVRDADHSGSMVERLWPDFPKWRSCTNILAPWRWTVSASSRQAGIASSR